MGKLKRNISELDGLTLESVSKEHITNDKLIGFKKKFIDNFIYDFTQEELAAKHTLETLFNKSHSFSYTYKCIKYALDLDPMQIGYFIKAIAAVADLHLIKLNESQNVFDSGLNEFNLDVSGKNRVIDSPTEYEMGTHNSFDLFDQKDSNIYHLIDEILSKLINDINIPMDTDANYSMDDVFWYATQLESGFLSKLLPFGPELINNLIEISKSNLNMPKFNRLSNILLYTLERGTSIISHWITKILNKSETSGTSLFDASEIQWQETNNCNCIDVLIKLFNLSESIHNNIPSYEMAKEKLARLEKLEKESIENKRKLDMERAKKMNAKRTAVNFILERKVEYDKLTNNSKMKHPFYIIGQDARNSNISSIKKLSKKLKSLLHPDTETDPIWKDKCEKSFKEASSALDLCIIWLKNPIKLSLCVNGPLLDFFNTSTFNSANNFNDNGTNSFNGNNSFNASNEKKTTNSFNVDKNANTLGASTTNPFNVTYMIIPDFTIECIDTKIGTLQITVDTTMISQKIFVGNTFFNVLVHRPIHGDEPVTLVPNLDKLSSWKKVDIAFANSCYHTTTINAVQPLSLGSMKKYFIGVQVGCKNGSSLIKWKSIYIELDKKGRSSKQIEILLDTFEGAPFISDHSNVLSSIRGSKHKMEQYLNECIESAQRWANKN